MPKRCVITARPWRSCCANSRCSRKRKIRWGDYCVNWSGCSRPIWKPRAGYKPLSRT